MSIGVVILTVLNASIAAAVGSAVGPFTQGRIDKRREVRVARRGLVASWRLMLAEFASDDSVIKPAELLGHADFVTLRPRLSEATLRLVEAPRNHVTLITDRAGIGGSAELRVLSSEIDRIEKMWRLR